MSAAHSGDGSRWFSLRTGLSYCEVRQSDGAPVCTGERVTVHYKAYLASQDDRPNADSLLESTWDPESPVTFVVGGAEVLRGVDEGVVGMTVAGERLLLLAPELAFGSRGYAGVVAHDPKLLIQLYVVTKD